MNDSRQTCSLPGCRRPTQTSAGNGHSQRYCKHHVEFRRRHGSYWFASLTADELRPFRAAAASWLKFHRDDIRVKKALQTITSHLSGAGPEVDAYSLREKTAKERAQIAFARLRNAGVPPTRILLRLIAVSACCDAKGIDRRQREYRQVQFAKAAHRLASGTHRTTSGFPLPPKYPRSEGQVLRHMGAWLEDVASLALNGRDVGEQLTRKIGSASD
jgi:hypothetical protein